MDIYRTNIGYENIKLSLEPDYEKNRTVYTVTDMRRGHFNSETHEFETFVFETPCEAMAKYKELCAEFTAGHDTSTN